MSLPYKAGIFGYVFMVIGFLIDFDLMFYAAATVAGIGFTLDNVNFSSVEGGIVKGEWQRLYSCRDRCEYSYPKLVDPLICSVCGKEQYPTSCRAVYQRKLLFGWIPYKKFLEWEERN